MIRVLFCCWLSCQAAKMGSLRSEPTASSAWRWLLYITGAGGFRVVVGAEEEAGPPAAARRGTWGLGVGRLRFRVACLGEKRSGRFHPGWTFPRPRTPGPTELKILRCKYAAQVQYLIRQSTSTAHRNYFRIIWTKRRITCAMALPKKTMDALARCHGRHTSW